MDWKEKIIEGMKLIRKGCAEQDEYFRCGECPFAKYCVDSPDLDYPEDWEIEEDE